MGSAMYIWRCERPVTQTQMLIASVTPLVLPYTLVFVSIGLQCVLFLIQTILAAMMHHELVIMCMASVLVGASAGAGYVIASHKITEFTMSETERLQKEQEAATDLEEDDYEDEDEDEDDDDDEDAEIPNSSLAKEPSPKMIQSLTELSAPSQLAPIVPPKQEEELSAPSQLAPIAPPQQEEAVQAPVVTADLTAVTPPAI